jgi:hypothetical protein
MKGSEKGVKGTIPEDISITYVSLTSERSDNFLPCKPSDDPLTSLPFLTSEAYEI